MSSNRLIRVSAWVFTSSSSQSATVFSSAYLRNKALLVTGYTTLCRRGELVRPLVEDLQVDADGFGTVIVRKSKTDQTGKGAAVAITADAMHHLRAWIDAARI